MCCRCWLCWSGVNVRSCSLLDWTGKRTHVSDYLKQSSSAFPRLVCQVIFWSEKRLLVNYRSFQVHVFVGTWHLVLKSSERTHRISRGSPKDMTFTFTVHPKMVLHETRLSSKAEQQCIQPRDKWTQQFCTLLTAVARPLAVVPRGGWGSWTVLPQQLQSHQSTGTNT